MLLAAILLLLLPETHGYKLPDVIDDVEKPPSHISNVNSSNPTDCEVDQELITVKHENGVVSVNDV